MIRKYLIQFRWIKFLICFFGRSRAEFIANDIKSYIRSEDNVLDIGAGICQVSHEIQKLGTNITAIDIINLSCVHDITPVIYSGSIFPFEDDQFDVALLITVLHHTNEQEFLLSEAARVAKKVIVKEDVYKSNFQKWATFFMDSILNFEFLDHPHTNRSDEDWQIVFDRLELKVINKKFRVFGYFFLRATYCLTKVKSVSKVS